MNWALPKRAVKLGSRTLAFIDGDAVGVITLYRIPRTNRSQVSICDCFVKLVF